MSKFKLKTTPYAQAQFNSAACKSQNWDLKSKKKALIKRKWNAERAREDEPTITEKIDCFDLFSPRIS